MASAPTPKFYRCYWVDEESSSPVREGYADEPAKPADIATATGEKDNDKKKKKKKKASKRSALNTDADPAARYRLALITSNKFVLTDSELLEHRPEMPFNENTFGSPNMFTDHKQKAILRVLQQTRPSLLTFSDDNGYVIGANVLLPNPAEERGLQDAFAITKRIYSAVFTPIARARNQLYSLRGQFENLRVEKGLNIDQTAIERRVHNFTLTILPTIRMCIESTLLSYLGNGIKRYGFSSKMLEELQKIVSSLMKKMITWSWEMPMDADARVKEVGQFLDNPHAKSYIVEFLNDLILFNRLAFSSGNALRLSSPFSALPSSAKDHPLLRNNMPEESKQMDMKIKIALEAIIPLPRPEDDLAVVERRKCTFDSKEACKQRTIGRSAAQAVDTRSKKTKKKAKAEKEAAKAGAKPAGSFYYY